MAGETNRTGLGSPALIIALLAALGIGPSLIAQKSSSPAARGVPSNPRIVESAGAANGDRDDAPEHSAAALLENFLSTSLGDLHPEKPWSRGDHPSVSQARPLTGSRNAYAIEFLIATLPEPGSPPLRSQFDADLDAISFALGRAGYALASFDLPWIDDAQENSKAAESEHESVSAGGDSRSSPKAAAGRARRSQGAPGVMLFHHEMKDGDDSDISRLLALLIVGESPTRGVNQAALRDALDQVAWLSGWKPGRPAAPLHLRTEAVIGREAVGSIRIIGPSFSGSAVSIRNTLEEWATSFPAPPVRIISGAATAIGDELSLSRPPVEFSTLRVPDAAMLPIIRRRFLPRGEETPPIVILSENTTYGSSFATVGRNRRGMPSAGGFLKIPFPLHISDLRAASGKQGAATVPAAGQLSSHNLRLPDEAGQQQQDVVPTFSPRSTVYSELVLENLLATIRDEHARYVGVVATDVEDLTFLVHEIRAHCPDVVVFTTSSDLLFTHSDFAPDLAGMIVFSTFPLFNQNQSWTNSAEAAGVRLQFPSEDTEGTYNATLAQLDRPAWILDYGRPFVGRADDAFGPADPFGIAYPEEFSAEPLGPVLWMSVVGRGGLWPLDFETPASRMQNVMPLSMSHRGGKLDLGAIYPFGFQVASLVLTALCLLPCVVFLWPRLAIATPPRSGSSRPLLDLLVGESIFNDLRAERDLRVAAFIGALLIAYLVGVGIYLLPLRVLIGSGALIDVWHSLPWPITIVGGFGLFVTIPVTIAALVAACRRIDGWPLSTPVDDRSLGGARRYSVQPTWASFALIGTITGILLVAAFIVSVWCQSPARALFSFVRAVNLNNRVSSLMPLIFLGTANLCLIGGDLWRLRLLEDCRVTLPFLGFDAAESFRGVAPLEERVIDALECPPWRLSGWWLMLLILGVGFTYFATSKGGWVYPIDGAFFDLLFFLSAAFIYMYFSILLLRFVEVWNALHRLLRRLYWHPTRGAYETLRTSTLPGRPEDQRLRLIEPRPSLTATEYCLQRARDILLILGKHPAAASLSAALAAAIARVEACISRVLAATAVADWSAELREQVHAKREMSGLSAFIVNLVEPVWRLDGREAEHPLNEDEKHVLEAANLFVASRVLDFLRQIFPQFANLAGVAMTGVLAMMLSLSVYPFVQRDTMIWMSWAVLLTVIGVSLTVFVQVNRSRVISLLMGTTPGRFNWDGGFSIQLLIYGLLPVLTLLGAQYPHTFGSFLSWATGMFGGGK
jgi:hypothetical protein